MRKTTGMTDEVRKCLAEMDVTDEVLAKVRSASNHTDGAKFLDEAKEICKHGFRKIAKKYHPDHNQQLPAEEMMARQERFKRLKSVYESFMESKYRGPRRSNTQMAAQNFDPFGFSAAHREAALNNLRGWHTAAQMAKIEREREEKRRRAIEILRQAMKNMDK